MADANTVNQFIADVAIGHKIIHGPGTGPDSTVTTDGGPVRTFAKIDQDFMSEHGDALLIQSGVYATEEAGRLAVADGQAFKVQGAGDVAAFEYRRNSASSSTLIAIYPSSEAFQGLKLMVATVEQNTGHTQKLYVEGWSDVVVDAEDKLISGITADGVVHIQSAQIADLQTPGFSEQYPNIDGWASVELDAQDRVISGTTESGARYETLPGKGLTKVSDPAEIAQMKDDIADLQQGGGIVDKSTLQDMVAALKNPLRDVTIVAIGSSSTWGRTLPDGAPYEPRNGTLADVRNNLTSPSYMNLLINYLGHVYTNTALADRATEETAPGAPAGGAGRFVDTGKFVDPMASDLVGLYSQIGEPIEKTATAQSAGPMVANPLNVPPGAYIEFVVTGAHFRVVYATSDASTSAEFDTEIDGVSAGTQNYYSASQMWSQVKEFTFAFGEKTVRVRNTSTTATLVIEAITRDKTVRIVNQGIIGTATSSWQPGGVRLDACLHAETTHMLVMIGSNDRGATVYPPNVTKTKEGNRNIVRHLRDVKGLKVILMAGQATTDDYPEYPAKTYSQQDIANAIGELAREEKVSFINMYPRTRQALLDGEEILADGLHPNAAGHRINFEVIKDAIESV